MPPKKNFVRQRRSKAERRRIYQALRKVGYTHGQARRLRDWTVNHIKVRMKVELKLLIRKLRSFASCIAVRKKILREIH